MPRTTIAVFGAGGVGVSTGPASAGFVCDLCRSNLEIAPLKGNLLSLKRSSVR